MARLTKSQVFLNLIQQLKIRTPAPAVIPFQLNKPQHMVWSKIAPKLDAGERVWVIILKARREGVSTLAESLMFIWTATQPLVRSLVIAHDFDAAKKVWEMSQRFLTDGPYRHIGKMQEHSIRFGDSILEVDTAASPHSRRGSDTTCCHFSELAFWKHEEALLATIQTLPKPPIQSLCIIESTANGMVDDGEQFYNEWQRAVAGESGFTPIFLSWIDFPDYRIPGAQVEDLDDDERELVKVFHVTPEQLAWRRYAINDLCQGDLDRFNQEYPDTPEAAFVQSGLPFFASRELMWIRPHLAKGKRYRVDVEGKLTEDPQGYLEIWKLPDPRYRYVVGADSSMGIEEVGSKSRSRSAGEVICMETMEQVAEYDAVSAPHIMSRHLAGIGRLYNRAILCPEVTASGGGGGRELIVYLKELNYYDLHIWRHADHIRRSQGQMYGWECPHVDSKVLTADLRWVRAGDVVIGDRLMGCRESCHEVGKAHALRIQTVTNNQVFTAPIIEVTLANGQQTCVSNTHPFLVRRSPKTGWQWVTASEVQAGDCLRYIPMWDTLRTYEAGRLSAFLDGEGHLARSSPKGGYQLLISQAEGLLADEIRDLWGDLGFQAPFKWVRHKKRPHEKPVATVGVLKLIEVLRALGSLRPTRLLRRFFELFGDGIFTVKAFPIVQVESVRSMGDGQVVGLTTDPDHTLIADGIVGHNTNARTRPRMIARIREVINEQSAVIHSEKLLKQLSAFGESDSGKMEALAGHDDLLFAWGIALMSRSENYFTPINSLVTPSMPDFRDLGIRMQEGYDANTLAARHLGKVFGPQAPKDKHWLEY